MRGLTRNPHCGRLKLTHTWARSCPSLGASSQTSCQQGEPCMVIRRPQWTCEDLFYARITDWDVCVLYPETQGWNMVTVIIF